MKNAKHNILVGSILIGSVLVAGNVTIPNSFVANTTAKASEVNANFSAVKSAVNGNASDIAANANGIATNKSDIQTNATNIAANVKTITASKGVEASRTGSTVAIRLKNGKTIIHSSAFNVSDETGNACELVRYKNYISFSNISSTSDCKAYASVSIPYNAAPDKLTCEYVHNDNNANTVFTIYQQYSYYHGNHMPPDYEIKNYPVGDITDTLPSVDVQVKSASITLPFFIVPVFDKIGPSSYVIEYAPSATDSAGGNEKLYDCYVDYHYI